MGLSCCRRALEEPGMQLHFLPLAEVYYHLRIRGCSVLDKQRCDDHVFVPGRDSTAHCVLFAKLTDAQGP